MKIWSVWSVRKPRNILKCPVPVILTYANASAMLPVMSSLFQAGCGMIWPVRAGVDRKAISCQFNLFRHYYALHRLPHHEMGSAALQDTERLKHVVQHKKLFFAASCGERRKAVPGTFRLAPPADHANLIRQDYGQMWEMLFCDIFGESIMQTLNNRECSINGTSGNARPGNG